jgi:hypothetical protein
VSQAETFAEAMARIKREVAKQPEADRLGYIKGAVNNCASLSEPDRFALFDVLMEIPSQTSTSAVSFNPTISQVVNQPVSQVANPQISQTQNANPHLEVAAPPSASGGPSTGKIIAIVAALITAVGGVVAAWITSHAPKTVDTTAQSAHSATTDSTVRDTSRSAKPPPVQGLKGTKQTGAPKKP